MRHQHSAAVVAMLFALIATPTAGAHQPDQAPLREFNAAVEKYVAFQRSLRTELPPLTAGSDPETINSASDVLALAIQRGRPEAHQGDLFTPAVRKLLDERLARALAKIDFAALTGANDREERSTIRAMQTYARFPVDEPLATMPASVLDALPPLPPELEYRFVGSDLIIRDRDARLVLDYMRITPPRR
jgi:hypothetical protein